MYGVDLYRRVRLACHREGLSRREASRQFGIDRKTVAKILLHSEPPGYRRRQPPKRPKLAPFTDIIDGILEEDRTVRRLSADRPARAPRREESEPGHEQGGGRMSRGAIPAVRNGTMQMATTLRRSTHTFLTHLFGPGLDDDRYHVERF